MCSFILQKFHRKQNVLEGSMFDDKHGQVLYDFPHISGFPLESMHVIDGGVIKDIHDAIEKACKKVRLNPGAQKTIFENILDTDVHDMVQFLRRFTLIEQERKLRYELRCACKLFNIFIYISISVRGCICCNIAFQHSNDLIYTSMLSVMSIAVIYIQYKFIMVS